LLTSLGEIAEKLGVSRAAMYYYVADRQDLVFQCYRRAAEIIARHLLEAARTGGNAAEVLRAFIARMLDPSEPEIAARAEIAMMNPTQRDTIQGLYEAIATRLAHILAAGQREGVLRSCDVEVNARIILSLVTWAPLAKPWAHGREPLAHPRLVAAVTATVLAGLSTNPTPPDFLPINPLRWRLRLSKHLIARVRWQPNVRRSFASRLACSTVKASMPLRSRRSQHKWERRSARCITISAASRTS
jgi:AcrR family transcriptional regulator